MRLLIYHWFEDTCAPIRLCLTNSPHPMKPHSQSELELMYFYSTTGCRYDCRGNVFSPKSGDLIIVNPREMHACGDWGQNCFAICVILDMKKYFPIKVNCTLKI